MLMNELSNAGAAFNPEQRAGTMTTVQSPWLLQGLFPSMGLDNKELMAYFRKVQSDIASNEAVLSNMWLDWCKQSGSMFMSWMDNQHQLGESWRQAMIGQISSTRDPAEDRAESAVENWREAALKSVHLQNEWLAVWASMMGLPQQPSATTVYDEDDGRSDVPQGADSPTVVSVRRKPARAEEVA
jgi:hypothetical protein